MVLPTKMEPQDAAHEAASGVDSEIENPKPQLTQPNSEKNGPPLLYLFFCCVGIALVSRDTFGMLSSSPSEIPELIGEAVGLAFFGWVVDSVSGLFKYAFDFKHRFRRMLVTVVVMAMFIGFGRMKDTGTSVDAVMVSLAWWIIMSAVVVGPIFAILVASPKTRPIDPIMPSKIGVLGTATITPILGKWREVKVNMLQLFRFLLIAASLGWAGFFLFVLIEEDPSEFWLIVGVVVACILNAVYLILVAPSGKFGKSRLVDLLDLWLDAKAAELRQRAKRADPS